MTLRYRLVVFGPTHKPEEVWALVEETPGLTVLTNFDTDQARWPKPVSLVTVEDLPEPVRRAAPGLQEVRTLQGNAADLWEQLLMHRQRVLRKATAAAA
jgi:hypothetical protein